MQHDFRTIRHILWASLATLMTAACTPAPAPEPTAVSDDPAAIHEWFLVLDTHLDTPVHFDRPGWSIADRHEFTSDLSHVDLPRMREGGLDGGWWVVYIPQEGELDATGYAAARRFAGARLDAIHRVVGQNSAAMAIARRRDDAWQIAAQGKRVVFISVENSYPVGDDLALLADWQERGVTMVGPVHNRGNQLGDSAGGPVRWGGLSPLGRRWVAEMNRLGMVIDVSHASDAAFDQILALSAVPVIASHSGVKAIFDHPRNLDDARIRTLAAKGGVLQLNSVFLNRFNVSPARSALYDRMDNWANLTSAEQRAIADEWAALTASGDVVQDADFNRFMAALVHCIELVGYEHCGIGADWDGGGGVRGMEDVVALPQITVELMARGYRIGQIQRIWGYNALRVLGQAQRYAERAR